MTSNLEYHFRHYLEAAAASHQNSFLEQIKRDM